MNTPRTKPVKRLTLSDYWHRKDGQEYLRGIENEQIAKAVGEILTRWPHVEDHMISLFSELTTIADLATARLVFRTIVNQNARIDIMRSMLAEAPHNMSLDKWSDHAIDEFASLNSMRNKYAHGLWWTRKSDNVVFLEERSDSYNAFEKRRRISAAELAEVQDRIVRFAHWLRTRWNERVEGELQLKRQTR